MVTDGRFSSLFACLTWKRSPTERLLGTPLRAAQVRPQRGAANALYMLESGTNTSKPAAGDVIEVELR